MKTLPKLPFPGAVDGDGHVLEPPDLWEHYLEAGLRKRAPGIRVDEFRCDFWLGFDTIPDRCSVRFKRGAPIL